MRNILVLISIFCTLSLVAQTVRDIGKVTLGVKVEENSTADTKLVSNQLRSKLQQLATQAGYSSYGNNQFYISPTIIVNIVDIAEGGMRTIYVVQGELNLSIVGGFENTIYSSMSFSFKGSGISQEKAILNGVLKINYSNVEDIFNVARHKILKFYENKQDVIFSQADFYVKNKEFEKAIACLMLIPEELSDLYKVSLTKAIEVYEKRDIELKRQAEAKRREDNEAILRKAQSFISMSKPEEALRVLWSYRGLDKYQNNLCDSLILKSERMIGEEKARELEREKMEYEDRRLREDREWRLYEKTVEHEMDIESQNVQLNYAILESETKLEQQRVESIKTIACEALKNNPNLLNNLK